MCRGQQGGGAQTPDTERKGQTAKFNLRLGWSGEIWFPEDGMGRRAGSEAQTPNPLSDLYSPAYRVWLWKWRLWGKGMPPPEPFCAGNFLFGTTMTQLPPPPSRTTP